MGELKYSPQVVFPAGSRGLAGGSRGYQGVAGGVYSRQQRAAGGIRGSRGC